MYKLELLLTVHEVDKNSTENRHRVLKLQTSKNSSVGSRSYVTILKARDFFKNLYYDQKYF